MDETKSASAKIQNYFGELTDPRRRKVTYPYIEHCGDCGLCGHLRCGRFLLLTIIYFASCSNIQSV